MNGGLQVVLQVSSQMFSLNVQQATGTVSDRDGLIAAVRQLGGELVERAVQAIEAGTGPVLYAHQEQEPASGMMPVPHGHVH